MPRNRFPWILHIFTAKCIRNPHEEADGQFKSCLNVPKMANLHVLLPSLIINCNENGSLVI